MKMPYMFGRLIFLPKHRLKQPFIILIILVVLPSLQYCLSPMQLVKAEEQKIIPTVIWRYEVPIYDVVVSVSVSSDGSYIVALTRNGFFLLLSRDGRLLWNYSIGYYYINSVSISSDGSYIAVGARDPLASRDAIFLFSRDGRLLWNYSIYSIYCLVVSVSISSDGSYIAVGNRSAFGYSTILLLSRDGRLLLNYSTVGAVYSISISSDGSYMATSLSNTIYFFGLSWKALSPFLTLYDPQIAGLTVSINGTTAPGYKDAKITRIFWDWGDGFSEDHSFPASHTYSKPGTYTITVTAYQSDGLSTTKTLTLKVEAENSPPIVDFSYSPPLPLAGEAVSFIDKSYDPDGNIVLWHWDFGDGTTSSDRNPTHVYVSPGTYTVTLTVRDNKGTEKSIIKIIQVEAVQTVRTSKSKYLFTLATIMLGVLIVLTTSYILAKRRTPKPPPLPPPPPPS
uniref:PKD domain-containing protein n=1 Tax=Thermofilum adornatum TaxID=1365176 RepID=A0A7C1CFC2_9CREN